MEPGFHRSAGGRGDAVCGQSGGDAAVARPGRVHGDDAGQQCGVDAAWATQPGASGLGGTERGLGPGADHLAFQLSEDGQHLRHSLAVRGR